VRPAGLSVELAASKLHHLLTQARLLERTGIGLKDEVDSQVPDWAPGNTRFQTGQDRSSAYSISVNSYTNNS
jgi:hypothetical protein